MQKLWSVEACWSYGVHQRRSMHRFCDSLRKRHESVHAQASEWTNKAMNRWISDSTDESMNEAMNQRMSQWSNVSTNQWNHEAPTNQWNSESMNQCTFPTSSSTSAPIPSVFAIMKCQSSSCYSRVRTLSPSSSKNALNLQGGLPPITPIGRNVIFPKQVFGQNRAPAETETLLWRPQEPSWPK